MIVRRSKGFKGFGYYIFGTLLVAYNSVIILITLFTSSTDMAYELGSKILNFIFLFLGIYLFTRGMIRNVNYLQIKDDFINFNINTNKNKLLVKEIAFIELNDNLLIFKMKDGKEFPINIEIFEKRIERIKQAIRNISTPSNL